MNNRIALWKGLRIQSNGIIFFENTQKPVPEITVNGERYVRREIDEQGRAIKVAKLVYSLFSDNPMAKSIDRTWNVEYIDKNPRNCNIKNLKFVLHNGSEYSFDEQLSIYKEYKRGVRGSGYWCLSKKYNTTPFKIKYIVDKFSQYKEYSNGNK